MKILVLADNFLPEIAATSFRVHEHARVWIEQGHEVTVVTCAPNWPHGKLFDGYRNKIYQQEWMDGIRVIRVGTYISANRGFLRRTLDFISFMVSATLLCWRFPKFDVLLATSPQFFTALAGWLIAVIRRRPWVFEVRDLWPESLKAVGVSKGRLIQWLEKLELFLYRRADRIITVTNSFRENLIQRGIAANKIDVVTNGVDLNQFDPARIKFDGRKRLGVSPDIFLTGYVGTTGMAHGLETIVTAAERLRQRDDIHFVIMGEGAERSSLEELVRQKGLHNVQFQDRVPHQEIPGYLHAFDLPIIHLRADPLFKTVIPSKLFEFMAMERPVLMAVEGEVAAIVRDAQSGICIRSGDADAMAQAIETARPDPESRRIMGRRGRQAVQSQYSRRVKALSALETLALASGDATCAPDMTDAESPRPKRAA